MMDGIEHPADRWHARPNMRAAYGPIRTEVRPEHLARVLAARSVRANPRLHVRHETPPSRPVGFVERVVRRVFG
jgi:hypothetical protein